MRLIDADALAERLGITKECKDCQYYKRFQSRCIRYDTSFTDVCEAIYDAPTVPQWIPVTERLPGEGYGVLVYEADNRNIFMASIENGKWYSFDIHNNLMAFDESDYGEPVAWMPLPEPPYKGGE